MIQAARHRHRHPDEDCAPAQSQQHTTMDLTPVFNQVLATHDSQPLQPYVFRKENLDEFLKEAYRIVCHVAHFGSEQAS